MVLTLSAACHVGGPDAGDLGTFPLWSGRHTQQPSAPAEAPDASVAARDAAAAMSDTPSDAGKTPDASSTTTTPRPKSAWLRLGYDLGATFNNTAETILSKQTAGALRLRFTWEVGQAVYGAPLLVDDRLYYVDSAQVHAVDLSDGTVIWEARPDLDATGALASNSLSYDDGKLYLHTRGAAVIALDALDGKVIWHSMRDAADRFDRGYSSPIVAGDFVLVGRAPAADSERSSGMLIAHDKRDGMARWSTVSGGGIWAAPSVSLDLGLVYVPTGPRPPWSNVVTANSLLAVELIHGAQRFWLPLGSASEPAANGGSGFEFGASPIVFTVERQGVTRALVAAGTRTGKVHVVDASTGELVWLRELGRGSDDGDSGILANGAWSGKYLLFAMNEGTGRQNAATLYALDGATGDQVWSRKLEGADVLGRITVANGVGFVGYGSEVMVFDTDTGDVITTISTEGPTAAGVASIANGIVAFGTGASYLAHDDADRGKLFVYEVPRP